MFERFKKKDYGKECAQYCHDVRNQLNQFADTIFTEQNINDYAFSVDLKHVPSEQRSAKRGQPEPQDTLELAIKVVTPYLRSDQNLSIRALIQNILITQLNDSLQKFNPEEFARVNDRLLSTQNGFIVQDNLLIYLLKHDIPLIKTEQDKENFISQVDTLAASIKDQISSVARALKAINPEAVAQDREEVETKFRTNLQKNPSNDHGPGL